MKILYVTTILGTMSFFVDEIKHLLEQGYNIEVAANTSVNARFCADELGICVYHIPFSRSPFSLDNIKAYYQLYKLVREKHYDIVHCHTPNAAAITRVACKSIRKNGTKVIYTAHGFHFFSGAPIKNWIFFYPVEWLCAFWTDRLITINNEDYTFALKKIKACKVEYVPGIGIDLSKFNNLNIDIVTKRKELNLPKDAILLLSVGELNYNKNHETVIRAIKGMKVYYLIAGKGDYNRKLIQVANEVGVKDRIKLLGFRKDIIDLLHITDIFVFPSFREGLSVSLMEAMGCGKPAVVSKIRGNIDLIDENGGALFNPHSVEECRAAINKVIESDRLSMGIYNQEKVKEFDINKVINRIDEIYESCL